MITSGIEVEKKQKQSFLIKHEDSPKILITANYPVKGPGGSSDERRRYEFELTNYFNHHYTPEMEFKKRFFTESWNDEWNKFFMFMMECIRTYLQHGLVKTDTINLGKAKIVNETAPEFYLYVEKNIQVNEWQDKRAFEENFKKAYPRLNDVSSHTMRKWLSNYATSIGCELDITSTGGKYLFKISNKMPNNSANV